MKIEKRSEYRNILICLNKKLYYGIKFAKRKESECNSVLGRTARTSCASELIFFSLHYNLFISDHNDVKKP